MRVVMFEQGQLSVLLIYGNRSIELMFFAMEVLSNENVCPEYNAIKQYSRRGA